MRHLILARRYGGGQPKAGRQRRSWLA